MKINQIKILFIIYSFFILIPFYKSEQIKIINIESIENSNNQTQQNLSKNNRSEDDYKDDDDYDEDDKEREREKERDKDRERDRKEKERDRREKEREREDPDKRDKYDWGNWEMSDEVKNLSDQVFNLNNEIDNVKDAITMNKIYMVLYSIVAGILFLVIVIYSSIKCFILCTKRNVYDYRLSYITDKLGEFYLDENENENDESKINKKEKKSKSKDYGAPISASNSNQKSKFSTFNPDNYISSNEDKKLYKPYKNEDIQ